MSPVSAVPAAPSVQPSQALKPESVAPATAVKPMPQATIKLQPAPAPAAAASRKPSSPASSEVSKPDEKADAKARKATPALKIGEHVHPQRGDEELSEAEAAEVPLTFLIAAAVLSLAALAIQLWTFLS